MTYLGMVKGSSVGKSAGGIGTAKLDVRTVELMRIDRIKRVDRNAESIILTFIRIFLLLIIIINFGRLGI